jgi:penicillin-binding protein 1A
MTTRPQGNEQDPDGLGPQTFRADLLHQDEQRLNRVRRALIAAGVAFAMLTIVGLAHAWRWYFGDLPKIPPTAELATLGRAPGMTFLDRYGRVIATRGAKYGRSVRLSELPPYVPAAFLAAEDKRFRSHGAVDFKGVVRASATNLHAGRTVQGGSTLTQQLARNLFLGQERTFKRKLQEAVLSYELEQRLGKDRILELYLNRVYLGENAFGIDAAAHAYFGKSARELSLAEAAVLAGLPKAPSRLSLTRDLDGAARRGRLVLDLMRREGWITAQQAWSASQTPVVLVEREPEGDLAWALDLAASEARSDVGAPTADLVVRTSIEPELQTQSGRIVREALDGEGRRVGASQAAVVLLGPEGAVRALIGGRNHDDSPFNRAVMARRQPGSAFKAFIWAAALDRGDKPEDFRSTAGVAFGPWRPRDHAAAKAAALSLADALAESSNDVSVRLATEVGPRTAAALARRFGVTTLPDDPGMSIALGTYEVSPLELTGAYQVLQQRGRLSRPHLVEEVARSDGTVLYRRTPDPPVQVYDPARADQMVRMMQGVIEHGTGVKARLDRPAAGKTGTTQENRDAWFVGFTPDWTAGVWVGNDDARPMRGVAGGDLPAEIWRRVMIAAHQGLPPRDFGPQNFAPQSVAGEAPAVVFDGRRAFYQTLASELGRTAGAK